MNLKKIAANKSLRSFLIYFGFDGFNKVLPLVILPIIAAYLTTSEYGLLTNFTILVQILGTLTALNSYSALSVSYFKVKDGIDSLLSNLIYLVLLLSFVCLLGILLFSAQIEEYLKISFIWQILALITASSISILTLYTTLLRMQKKAMLFGWIQLGQSSLMFVLAILFVVILLWNWQGRILSMVFSSLLSMLFCMFLLSGGEKGLSWKKLDFSKIKYFFLWGLPLLPHALSFWLKSGMDKIIITNMLGLSANGIYSVSLIFGGIISLFTIAFFNMYSPIVYEKLAFVDKISMREGNIIKQKLVKNTYLFSIALLVICVLSYFILKIVINWFFSGDYLLSIPLLPWVLLVSYFNGMYSIVSIYLFYKERTMQLGIITFLSSIFQMLFTYFGVKYWGITGAMYSGTGISILTFIAILLLTNKYYKLPWFSQNHG